MTTNHTLIAATRILIVDDDETSRLLAREALEQAGFAVDEASNGRVALEYIRSCVPDIVMLDMMMPEMDGFEACAAMREMPEAAHVPILMMTGRDDVESIDRAYEVGATDFASKPINYPLLAHRIRYILRAKLTADNLRDSEARLANAQRIARIGHFEWNIETGNIYCSPQLIKLFGVSDAGKVAKYRDFLRFVHPRDRLRYATELQRAKRNDGCYSIEHRIVRTDRKVRIIYQEGELNRGARGPVISATLQDITERRRMERKVLRIANFDAVTGLPNRQFMHRYLTEAIANARREHRVVAVLVVDIDNFARINDTLGHGQGDSLLKLIGGRLLGCIKSCSAMGRVGEEVQPDGDLLARAAGDEFVAVLTDLQTIEDAASIARRFMEALSAPCKTGKSDVTISISIGIGGFPVDGVQADEILQRADAALHHAKGQGRNRWEFSSASINEHVVEQFNIESDLRKAVAVNQFQLHYQPKVLTESGQLVGMEALLRWNHPEQGMIPPLKFIPIAEETGLIVPISEWVMHEACSQVQSWRAQGLPPLTVSVNISAAQMRATGLHLVVANALRSTGIDPTLLELELTESLLMNEVEANLRMMKKLRTLGLSLSIDDFGTGYSSLGYLRRFPVNALKIDRSFITELGSKSDDGAIVAGIIALAHSLRLKVVAEGVETDRQLQFLRERRCDEIQGYFFSRPLPAAEFFAWASARMELTPKLVAVKR